MTHRAAVLARSSHLLFSSSCPIVEYVVRRLILLIVDVDVGKGMVVKMWISLQEHFAGQAVHYDLIPWRVAEWNLRLSRSACHQNRDMTESYQVLRPSLGRSTFP